MIGDEWCFIASWDGIDRRLLVFLAEVCLNDTWQYRLRTLRETSGRVVHWATCHFSLDFYPFAQRCWKIGALRKGLMKRWMPTDSLTTRKPRVHPCWMFCRGWDSTLKMSKHFGVFKSSEGLRNIWIPFAVGPSIATRSFRTFSPDRYFGFCSISLEERSLETIVGSDSLWMGLSWQLEETTSILPSSIDREMQWLT